MHSDSNDIHETLGEAVSDSLGLDEITENKSEKPSNDHDELPEAAKKRLGMQEKRHKKELKRVQEQLNEMRQHLMSRSESSMNSPENNMNQDPSNQMDETVYRAVAKAMEMQKMQERQLQEQQKMQHVQKSYKALQDSLEDGSDQYEDFDDIVKSEDAPYTDAMRDAALLIENPKDVLYHLGKDKEKLKRISELHPLDQAKEVIKLSMALATGNVGKSSASNPKLLSQVKNNPTTSSKLNENTSVSEIRRRMKEGGKNWM